MESGVRVTILSGQPSAFDGWMIEVGKKNMSLRCPRALKLRTLLKVEADDCLWLGEVVGVRPEGSVWVAEMCIEHLLRGVADLTRLAERFVGSEADREDVEQFRA